MGLALALVSRRNSQSQAGTPVLGASSSSGGGMAPLSLGSTPLLSSALAPHPHLSPLSPHPPALSLHPSSAQTSGSSSLASTPSLHSTSLRERGTSPSLPHHRLSPGMMHHASASHATSPPPLALGTGSHPHASPHAQQQPSSAQFTNPYLSHTGFGGPGVPSGPFNDASGGSEADAAYAAAAAHHSAAFSAARAAAEAAVASYYPYHMLQGFLGPGFILGHANLQPQQPPQQPLYADPSSAVSPDPTVAAEGEQPAPAQQLHARSSSSSSSSIGGSLPHFSVGSHSGASSSVSSSCPSPLLTSTSERRRSKPHIQFVPPTHSVTPNGLVLPLIPPPPPPAPAPTAPATSTSARVSHAFNLFGLPPVFVYEIRVPPHVYLLTALILYFIGPPALIPLVATFFFYRWHLQNQASQGSAAAGAAGAAGVMQLQQQGGAHHQSPSAGVGGATPHKSPPASSPSKGGGHPSGMPKAQPSPSLGGQSGGGVHQRRHPNIHSLSDL